MTRTKDHRESPTISNPSTALHRGKKIALTSVQEKNFLGSPLVSRMALNLRCECADDDEFIGYRADYVEMYLMNRESEQQTIEDWTETEGLQFFPAGEIYRPVDLPVAITGSEANTFEVDVTRPEWRSLLQSAVVEAVMAVGLAKATDKVELLNMRREPLGEKVTPR